jgi:hypothetical protein
MPNLTLAVAAETLRRARKVAIERDTTLTAMVRAFIEDVARSDEATRERAVRRFRDATAKYAVKMGPRRGNREALHER